MAARLREAEARGDESPYAKHDRVDALSADIPQRKAVIASQRAELAAQQLNIASLKGLVVKPRRRPFGHRSERAGTWRDQLEPWQARGADQLRRLTPNGSRKAKLGWRGWIIKF